jgi:AcrR family transcriptional regulator
VSSASNARQARTIAHFVDAAVVAIGEAGIDRLSVSRIATLAGASRPTFYAYFGEVGGLLAELWLAKGHAFLEWLVNPNVSFARVSGDEKVELEVMAEVFAVAHRIPELAEVVNPSVSEWWQTKANGSEYVALKVAWVAAARLGEILTYKVDSDVTQAVFGEHFIWQLGHECRNPPPPLASTPLPRASDPLATTDAMDRRLMDAAVKVISTSGVAAASMTRISRTARVTTGAAYPRFSGSESLVLSAFENWITEVTDENMSQIGPEGFGPDDFGLFVMAGLQGNRKIWRNFRVETHLEGAINAELATSMKTTLRATNERVVLGLGQLPATLEQKRAIAYWVHTIGIGMAILFNAGLAVDRLDHRMITRDMMSALLNRPL